MTLKQADVIMKDYAKFLEITDGKLRFIFLSTIPQGLLPYSKKVIMEAFKIVIKHCEVKGDQITIDLILKCIPNLIDYVNDEEAFKKASSHFSNKVCQSSFKKYLGECQRDRFKYVTSNF